MPMRSTEDQRRYQREWVARRRLAFFADKRCVTCGSTEDLELDHVDPSQKIDHRVFSWSKARRDAEIGKCQILCKSCHQVKSVSENMVRAMGSRNGQSKLTEGMAARIRLQWDKGGVSKRGLAKQYGVSEKAIRLLLAGQTWKNA